LEYILNKNHVRVLGLNVMCAAAMLTSAAPAWSAMNKCTGTDGKVTYTEQPCEKSQTKTTVKIESPPPSSGQGSGMRKNRELSPGQIERCERARMTLEMGKREMQQERNKNKTDLLASAREEAANLEKLIREQCY
jgi:hypothetical protein